MNTRKRSPKSLVLARILLGGMLLVAVVLTCLANFLPRPADSAEIKAALDEAARDRAARDVALKEARRAVPKDAPIPADWEFSKILDATDARAGRMLVSLASSYVDDPNDIPEKTLERLRGVLDEEGRAQPGELFYFPLDPDKQPKTEILENLRNVLAELKVLGDVEEGLRLGLCRGAVNAYTSPRYSNIINLCVLFAGRAVCELQKGEQRGALQCCLTGYRLAALLGEWPHYYSHIDRYFADRAIDRALYRVVDAGLLGEQDQAQILESLDSRKSSEGLAKTLRLHAAYLEAGLEGEIRGYPSFVDYGFAFTGRGAMERAKQICALLDRPPCAVTPELGQIADHALGGYWVNRLSDNGIQAYKMHAREAVMGDVARIAFALKAHARNQGAYPASLQELGPLPIPQLPQEPLTGNPVVYQGGGNTFTITAPPAQNIWGEMYWVARQ